MCSRLFVSASGTAACTIVIERERAALRRQHLEEGRRSPGRHKSVAWEMWSVVVDFRMRSKAARRDADAPAAPAFVMDTGAANVRMRYVRHGEGSQAPIVAVPNAIGRTRAGIRKQVLIADQIETDCHDYGGLQLRLPIDRGLVVDWPAQKAIWDRLLQIATHSRKDASFDSFHALSGSMVVATEPYFNLPDQQRALEALMFDWYGADSVWCATRTFCGPSPLTSAAQLAPFAPSLCRAKAQGARSVQQPECILVVDCGHSYTHAIPLIRNEPVWPAARRYVQGRGAHLTHSLDLGGRVLTNVLKEMFSFRQWNMMEETYLTDKMKPRSFFVAARATDDNTVQPERPCDWSFASLVERFHAEPDNALTQRYVLPEYAQLEDARNTETKYGHIVSGPGSKENPTKAKGLSEEDALDAFIVGSRVVEGTPGQRAANAHEHDDESQILTLGQERYLLFEYLFAPQRLGACVWRFPTHRRTAAGIAARARRAEHLESRRALPRVAVGERCADRRRRPSAWPSAETVRAARLRLADS